MTFLFGILSFGIKPPQNKKTAKNKKRLLLRPQSRHYGSFHLFICSTIFSVEPYWNSTYFCGSHPNGFQKRAFPNFVVDSNRRVYHPYRFVFYWPICTDFFGISIDALRIAGGIIIVSSGFSLLSGKFNKKRGINKKIETDAQKRNDIALTPLAIPMLAGPGSISLLIAFYQEHHSTSEIMISSLAIFAIAIAIFVILRSAHYLAKILGASGIVAISRIVGFIVIAIGIQYIVSAMVNIIKGNLL